MILQLILGRLSDNFALSAAFLADDVQDFPQLKYSMHDVIRAGKALKGQIVWTDERRAEIYEIFQIANGWRDFHAFPMHRLRAELHGRMSALRMKGLTAARLKRMPSIRAKLARLPGNLSQLQDLGGCRAVVPTIQDARRLVDSIKKTFRHELRRDDPYMDSPRSSGYRSHHLIYEFRPRDASERAFEGRRIELQIRTRLQHSWATAVEAVGMYISSDLKSGVGNPHWLQLFKLMSAELAAIEGLAPVDNSATQGLRKSELISLSEKLDAVRTLDTLSHAVADAEVGQRPHNDTFKYCLIQFNHVKRTVSVKHINSALEGTAEYGVAEREAEQVGQDEISSVLVQLDKINNLREAYPNYFGDVQLFKKKLTQIVSGDSAKEYSLPPVERVPPPPREIPDDSWLRQPRRRRWSDA